VAVVMLFSEITASYSSDTLSVSKSRLYLDNLAIDNIWINSSNPAGLAFFSKINKLNMVEAGYSYSEKGLKFPIEPGVTNSYFGRTKGFKKVGKLTFYGSFGYENEHYDKLLYNNTLIFDPDIPYILGDTIGGKQRKEGFLLKGAFAYPLTKKLIIGIDADYRNYVGAKLKDPRNKNDISSLIVTSGLIYNAGKISAGISGGPVIFNNDISVSVMENAKYSLFQFMGMGYYKSIKNIYSYSNAYFGNGFTTEAQVKYSGNKLTDLLTLNYNKYREEVRYDNTGRLIDGISNRLTILFKDYLFFRNRDKLHQVTVSLCMNQLSGTEVMQHFKSIIVGLYKYDTLIIDSWTKDKQIGTNYDGNLGYTITGYNGNTERYKINFGLSAQYQAIDHYPVQNYGFQTVTNIIPSAGYKRFFRFGSMTFIPEIGCGYRMNLMKDMDYFVTDQSIPEFQRLDYLARNSDIARGNASLMVLKKAGIKFLSEYFLDLKAEYDYIPDNGEGSFQNIFINCSIGLIF
jgi:hypothetical protein